MADNSKIEWCDATWNPVTGCSPISEGCEHCYACAMAKRFPSLHGFIGGGVYPDGEMSEIRPASFRAPRLHADRLDKPMHWRKPRRIFVCSMGDLFHAAVPDEWIASVFGVMARCQQHTFMLLTKRPERMRDIINGKDSTRFAGIFRELHPDHGNPVCIFGRNVWVGVTAENQQRADERIPPLLEIPAAVHFVSVEPMLGPMVLPLRRCLSCGGVGPDGSECPKCGRKTLAENAIQWVICGGETGPGAREMKAGWVIQLARECDAVGVPFFFKAWGHFHNSSVGYTRSERREIPV